MCLILFAHNTHPDYSLILGANRDEFYKRPTAPASWTGNILSGRDLLAGGTWMGINRNGRFAALTNYRNPGLREHDRQTRGELVTDWLKGEDEPADHMEKLKTAADRYNGYNLIFGHPGSLYWFSNMADKGEKTAPGIHGLSNSLLNTPWPKVTKGVRSLTEIISADFSPEDIFEMLRDTEIQPDETLPETGVPLEVERYLSPKFIRTPDYGTRASTVVMIDRKGGVSFRERTFLPDGSTSDAVFNFSL